MGRRPLVTAIETPQGQAGHRPRAEWPGPRSPRRRRRSTPRAGAPARGGYVLAVLGMVVGGGMLGAIPNTFIGALIRLLLIGLITRA